MAVEQSDMGKQPKDRRSDDEIRERLMSDPALRRRAEEVASKVSKGRLAGASVTREELPDFLRDIG
ncbi:MAG: hypothetical protein WEE66_00345 [Actinomycetota bacterium]